MTEATNATTAVVRGEPGRRPFDTAQIRREFPALHQRVHGKPLVYLDSAATALKPQAVIDAVVNVYARDCANIHRAVHLLSQRATKSYEEAREKIARFIGASSKDECVFLRGTTEAINLVAHSWGRQNLREGDEILVTGLEHHSNIVPWQMACQATGAKLVVAPVDDGGEVQLDAFREALSDRTRLVATAHVSNTLGTIQPAKEIVKLAKARGALVLFDGAQAVPHIPVDVGDLGCDFYAFSGHKLYGPTGIGVLWGRKELLDDMAPWQGGGDMIRSVTFEKTTYNVVPHKFEAGTPNIAGAIGLGAAVDYLEALGMDEVAAHEQELLAYGTRRLEEIPGLRILGKAKDKVGVLSFVMETAHPHDIGTIVDMEGVAIRTGHHCTQPLMERYGVAATARASLGVYNDESDVDALVKALSKVQEMFG